MNGGVPHTHTNKESGGRFRGRATSGPLALDAFPPALEGFQVLGTARGLDSRVPGLERRDERRRERHGLLQARALARVTQKSNDRR